MEYIYQIWIKKCDNTESTLTLNIIVCSDFEAEHWPALDVKDGVVEPLIFHVGNKCLKLFWIGSWSKLPEGILDVIVWEKRQGHEQTQVLVYAGTFGVGWFQSKILDLTPYSLDEVEDATLYRSIREYMPDC